MRGDFAVSWKGRMDMIAILARLAYPLALYYVCSGLAAAAAGPYLDAAALTGVSLAGDGGSWGGKCVRKRSMTAVRGICWRLPGKGRLCAARRTLKIGRSQRGRTGPQRSGGGSALHATP